MSLDDYQLLAQLTAGDDGVAYRARERGGDGLVELRVLDKARADHSRWTGLAKRLGQARRLTHPRIRAVRDLDLDADPPYVALELDERGSLADSLDASPLPSETAALELALSLAEALAAAHRLGLAHGALDPWTILGDQPENLAVDFTGSKTMPDRDRGPFGEAYRAHELEAGGTPRFSSDVFSLGVILYRLLMGQIPARPRCELVGVSDRLRELVSSMVVSDGDERPTVIEVGRHLRAILGEGDSPASEMMGWPGKRTEIAVDQTSDFISAASGTIEVTRPPSSAPNLGLRLVGASSALAVDGSAPERLGRFLLVEKLGEGGMGEVYKARDEADGSLAAIKVLKRELANKPSALQRFRKEARLLAQVRNPYVTNLLEVNEDQGIHYIVLEFVSGRSLDRDLVARGRLDEPLALAIAADVARGLIDAHRLGIVHRDIKPANILIVGDLPEPREVGRTGSRASSKTVSNGPRVKLSDFGLARHAIEAESQALTQSGVIVGTPTYMAPEQCSGEAIDARADVYSLGATLYHLVAGAPPFQAEDWRGVIAKHLNEPPPSLRKVNPDVSEGFCRVVERALAKSPDARYGDAAALLVDLDRLLRGEPTGLPMHPVLPAWDPKEVLRFDFEWELEASPRQLWPYVSNTDRINRAAGFGPVRHTLQFDPERGVRRLIEGRKAGTTEEGEELPYEWVEGRRLGVYREYAKGPFHWVVNIVELAPRSGGGTTLTQRLRLVPRGQLIRLGAGWGIGKGVRRDLERVYRRIDAALTGKLAADRDAFEPGPALPDERRRRLDERLALLAERGVDPFVVERLGDYLAEAHDQELARIRPIALARRLGLGEEAVVAACLHGANVGLLVLLWDLLCPVCRIASEVKETLRALTDHGHCPACHIDYELDFTNSVEMVFRVHPQVREADLNTYCAAGPAHSPHVVAQVRVQAGERFELDLELTPGAYRLRGPQLGWSFDFHVRPGAATRRWDLRLSSGPVDDLAPWLGAGGQLLVLDNDAEIELLLRVERVAPRDDALTAARATSLAVFRELFPAEVLAPGRLVNVSNVTLLVTALDPARNLYAELGDARAFALLHEQFRLIDEVVRAQGGAVVKTLGDGVLAAFDSARAAVEAALGLPAALESGVTTRGLAIRAAAHRGPAMTTTLNDQLDYFGLTVHQTILALAECEASSLVMSRSVSADPAVAARLEALGLTGSLRDESRLGSSLGPLLSIRLIVRSASEAPGKAFIDRLRGGSRHPP